MSNIEHLTNSEYFSHLANTGNSENTLEFPNIADLIEVYNSMILDPELSQGAQEARDLLFRDMYDPRFAALLAQLQQVIPDESSVTEAVNAFHALQQPVIDIVGDEEVSPHQAFDFAMVRDQNGEIDMTSRARDAREKAVATIAQHMSDNTDAHAIIREFQESKLGIEIPISLINQLTDPQRNVVVVSLDINSTFNHAESFGTPELNSKTQSMMKEFAGRFRRIFPHKQLVMAINTGRPGQYAWGFEEAAFFPGEAVRKVALAESGGVIIDGIENGEMHVAVENPGQWRKELDGIQSYVLSQIRTPDGVHIEPKQSMLSIQISDRNGKMLHLSTNGEVVDKAWFEKKIQEYFSYTAEQLDAEYEELTRDVTEELPEMKEYVEKAVKAYKNGNGHGNGPQHKQEMLREFAEAMTDVNEQHKMRAKAIEIRQSILKVMHEQGKLDISYNPTAGYVDIGHADLNKFSTMMKYITGVYRINPDQVCYIHIGDSTTDIIPTDSKDPGQPNEGADDAHLFGLANSNTKLSAAIGKRGTHGTITSRPSTLGTRDIFLGLNRELKKIQDARKTN